MRREDLYDSPSEAGSLSSNSSQGGAGEKEDEDEEDDAELRARLHARLESLLGLDLSPGEAPVAVPEQGAAVAAASAAADEQPQREGDGDDDDDDEREDADADADEGKHVGQGEEEEFEFRLFSTSLSKTGNNAPARVVLAASDDEDAAQGEGAFVAPQRPTSYYVAGEATPEQLQRYRCSAVAGEDVIVGARKRAWGLERPWRVIRITASDGLLSPSSRQVTDPKRKRGAVGVAATGAGEDDVPGGEGDGADKKRKRPGKKRRIATRIKAKAEREKREAEEKHKMSKEEHLAEKKKRLNREKKLKRRAKEREAKLATKGHGGTQPSEEAGSGSDADSAA